MAASLSGKVVWITGSAKRVGREMALACARQGAAVVVHYNNSAAEAEATREDLEALGVETLIVQGDHASPSAVEEMVRLIGDRFGRLDALVNSAAVFPTRKFEDISHTEFNNVIAANLYGPFLCAQKAAPLLRAAAPGRIVNIVDWSVDRPYSGYAHYMASKGGLHTLTRALARELAPEILVNGISPGPVLEPEDLSEEKRVAILRKLPLGRWGSAAAVAQTLVYILTCPDLCGEIITVDAGRSLG